MIKRYTFKQHRPYAYWENDSHLLSFCTNSLFRLFDIKEKEVDLVVSDKKPRGWEWYEVSQRFYGYWNIVEADTPVPTSAGYVLQRDFPGKATLYLWCEA